MSAPVRPFFWCVRRELWENRFVFIAPAAVGVLVVSAYLVGTLHLQQILSANPRMLQKGEVPPVGLPYVIAAVSVMATGILTGGFYALNALYAERRDRSILFWKSLPLSDRTVVLAKASIPTGILPAWTFLVTLVTHLAMLGLGGLFAAGGATAEPAFWINWPLLQMAVVLLYGLATTALWYVPIYGWLFLVSAWAKRAPFLWAVLPPLALCVAEKLAFNTAVLGNVLAGRLLGAFVVAFNAPDSYLGPVSISQIAPVKFLTMPDLWVGLLVGAGLFAGAIRLRRFRGSI